jgi:two-component system chemotaxis response regulator CheY
MKKALVIDDASITRHVNQKSLEKMGWQVMTATDGIDALRVLSEMDEVHLIMTDIHMPNMDGLELTKHIRSDDRFAHTFIMIVTSDGTLDVVEQALAAGANDVLIKPFSPSDFEARILSSVNG